MKYISLLIAIVMLLSFGGCTLLSSAPRHSAEEVAALAQSFNPTCRKLIPADPNVHH
jgi:hypothetical protein